MSKTDLYSAGGRPVNPRPKKGDSGVAFDNKKIYFNQGDRTTPRKSLLAMFQDMFGTEDGSKYLTSLERDVAEGKMRQRNMIIGGIIILCAFFC